MQRRIIVFCLALSCLFFSSRSFAQRGKSEFALGYGYWSAFSFVNVNQNYTNHSTSSGVTNFTYRYYVSRNVTLGMNVGYENISTWASFVTFAPEVTVAYMDTRKTHIRVKLYGSAAYGISILSDNAVGLGEADESGVKLWGGQISPFGIRVGKQFAGFLEVGYGYKGLFHGGLAFRFPRAFRQHEAPVN